jgi:hypothetical protein
MIDTGASRCIFHASIGEAIGLEVTKGKEEFTYGVSGESTKLYLHTVSIYAAGSIETTLAGFTYELPLAGLLGRRGFLDRFKFIYDASTAPPQFEVIKIAKA